MFRRLRPVRLPLALALALAAAQGCGPGTDLDDTGERLAQQTGRTPATPPRPPFSPPPSAPLSAPSTLSNLVLPALKAVLVVGPIDGDTGSWTTAEKANMDLAAAELQANGVAVHKYYTPQNDWGQIKAAATGAHFFLYRGHGVYYPGTVAPVLGGTLVGGLALKNGIVTPDQLRADLKTAPNAVVMLYGCFTAGWSSSDPGPITDAEARRRVALYSDPFLDVGAGGYLADWFGDAFQLFVRSLFQGKTLQQTYEGYFDFNPATVMRGDHPLHPGRALWIDKDNWDFWKHNYALAGSPTRTLEELFSPVMTLAPPAITLLAQPNWGPRAFAVKVGSTLPHTFSWTASKIGGAWLGVQPLQGQSGQSLTITLTPNGLAVGDYQGSVRVVTGDPAVVHGDQTVTVTLKVRQKVHQIFLPHISNGS